MVTLSRRSWRARAAVFILLAGHISRGIFRSASKSISAGSWIAAISWVIRSNARYSVAGALPAEQFDRFANFLGAADFACVHQAVQADFAGAVVDGAKFFCGD